MVRWSVYVLTIFQANAPSDFIRDSCCAGSVVTEHCTFEIFLSKKIIKQWVFVKFCIVLKNIDIKLAKNKIVP